MFNPFSVLRHQFWFPSPPVFVASGSRAKPKAARRRGAEKATESSQAPDVVPMRPSSSTEPVWMNDRGHSRPAVRTFYGFWTVRDLAVGCFWLLEFSIVFDIIAEIIAN